ncbi:hypothetical protein VNO77_18112 [Canavalia gladiata]|uniref:Uncharacterized protein n=1 Tax=Canavalia gladiata TaxID=3824 RepID=A0AAN9QJC0_CANGL
MLPLSLSSLEQARYPFYQRNSGHNHKQAGPNTIQSFGMFNNLTGFLIWFGHTRLPISSDPSSSPSSSPLTRNRPRWCVKSLVSTFHTQKRQIPTATAHSTPFPLLLNRHP